MNPNGAGIWHSYGFAVTMVAEPGVIVVSDHHGVVRAPDNAG
jgi:hypothetical protein